MIYNKKIAQNKSTPIIPSSKPSIIAETANTIMQGMALGSGSALGHRAVGAVFDTNPNTNNPNTNNLNTNNINNNTSECSLFFDKFKECVNNKNIHECENLLHKYKDCTHDA